LNRQVASAAAVFLYLGFAGGPLYSESEPREARSSARGDSSETEGEDETDSERGEERRETADEKSSTRAEKRRARAVAVADAGGPEGWLEQRWAWDLNLDLGFRLLGNGATAVVQGRTGATRISEPGAYSAGLTAQFNSNGRVFFGAEGEVLSLNLGTFARVGGAVGVGGEPRLSAGVGWQAVSFEVSVEPDAPSQEVWNVLAELRLPVSWIVRAIRED